MNISASPNRSTYMRSLLLLFFPSLLLVKAARSQVGVTSSYDPAYVSLKYPNGDIPLDRGVCTDVTIRSLRNTGFDLQRLVHEDMRKYFSAYPTS